MPILNYPDVVQQSELDAKQDATITFETLTNTLEIDVADSTYFKVSLNADELFDLSNIPTNKILYFLIISTNGLIQVTLPNAANDKVPALSTAIRATGRSRWITLLFDGTNRYWAISEEME